MRKVLMLGLVGALALAGCSDETDADAKSYADIACQAQKLSAQAASNPQNIMAQALKLQADAAQLLEKFKAKYTSDDAKQKFAIAMSKHMAKCLK
jgi:hypothetical protein